MTKIEFDINYSKHFPADWFKGSDTLFFRILGTSIVIIFSIIIVLANLQFENLDEHIKKQYQEFVLRLEPVAKKQTTTLQENRFNESSSATDKKAESEDRTINQSITPPINIPGIQIEELSHDGDGVKEGVNARPRVRSDKGQVKLEIDGLLDDPYSYKIERNAQIHIEEPVGQSEEKEKYGYRDQEEVFRIIETKSISIESCYEKAARFGMVKGGYVKVEFKITSDGFILPQSIRIIKSTLRNKKVEQCIKKNIRRLRGFEKLDQSKGIARVTHKFVFN